VVSPLRRLSSLGFGVILVCFFLPWASFSCSGGQPGTVTGAQFLVGTSLEHTTVEREEWAIATLVLAATGAALSLVYPRRHLLILALSVAALATHAVTAISIATHSILESAVGIQVHLAYGYWIVLVSLILVVGLNGVVLYRERKAAAGSRSGSGA